MLVLGLAALSLLPLRPPPPLGADAAAGEFSAGRALHYVERLAAAPRPTGSAASEKARELLVQWLADLGLEAELQPATVVERRLPGWVRGARVVNVVARLPGTDPSGTLLMMSHYDSVPLSPGAADAASGVAVLLETLRALRTGPPPRNDIVFLLTDGEEIGLYGAKAFLAEHRWSEGVELVMNFEARGGGGPSILFETGPVDAELMRRVARSVPRPLAASYSFDVYRRLPNATDFTPFKEAGVAGFNFAFIDDFGAYHAALDTTDRLDAASVQHHGSYALGLASHFAAADLSRLPERGSAIYFNLPLAGLVVYPSAWALPLAGLAAIATLVLLVVGLKRRRLRPLPLLAALAVVPAVVAVTAAAVYFGHRLWQGGLGLRVEMFGQLGGYLLGWALLALAVTVALLAALSRRLDAVCLAASAALWWSVIALATATFLPSTSYLFVWPLAFALLPLVPLLAAAGADDDAPAGERRPLLTVLLLLAPVGAILLWVPTVTLIGSALGLAAAVVTGLATALLAVLLSALLSTAGGSRRWWLPAASAVAGVVVLAVASLGAGYGEERPRPNSLFYALDSTSGEALWVSRDREADAWTGAVLNGGERRTLEGYFHRSQDVLATAAAALPLPPARVELAAPASGRSVALRVVPPPETGELRVVLQAAGGLRLLAVDGRPVEASERDPVDELEITFHAPPATGLEFEVVAVSASGIEVLTVSHRYGLPAVDGRALPPRPPGLQPDRFTTTDRSLVKATTTIPLAAED